MLHTARLCALTTVLAAAPLTLAGCTRAATGAPEPPPRPTPIPVDPAPFLAQQPPRPVPYPVFETAAFRRAVENGTRTRTGRPGPNYWQQYADYRIEAELDPAVARLTGRSTVRYHNRSPHALQRLAVHLYQNAHRPDAMRNRVVPITEGMELHRVAVNGRELSPRARAGDASGYVVNGTVLTIPLAEPLPPGGSAELEFAWSFTVPSLGAPRMGQDGEVFYLGYWYPQLAVYDDVNGWQTDPYMTNGEFYMGYADYDVALTVPEGWLVAATGTLQNPEQVLSATVRERLDRARRSPDVVRVVTPEDRGAGRATARGSNGKLTWRFRAQNVRDFAWGASREYVWDATHAVVGDHDADGRADTTMIHTLYRPDRGWTDWARYARHSVEFLSRMLWPYPWPHMTAVEGLISGGMEYPMITLIGGARDSVALYSVTVHEIGHMWFPMMVGSDEKRFAWQDEGLTRFNQSLGMADFFRGYDRFAQSMDAYARIVQQGDEVEIMRHADLYPVGSAAFGVASYEKTSLVLRALMGVLGEETFLRALREYGTRWRDKHPTPFDFFNTVEDVAGRDLDWFWTPWLFETWTLDQALGPITPAGGALEVVVEDHGLAPMPARVVVTRADGSTERHDVPVEVWLSGARRHVLRIAAEPAVTRIEIDPERWFPDIDRENQVWIATAGS